MGAVIWPDMKDSVAVFFAMATQWRWVGVGMGGAFRTGLDYPALSIVAAGLDVKLTPLVFSDIRTMEREALSYWSAH